MTSQLQRLLIELEAMKVDAAKTAVQNPAAITAESYGVAVGIQRGLEMASTRVKALLKAEEGRL